MSLREVLSCGARGALARVANTAKEWAPPRSIDLLQRVGISSLRLFWRLRVLGKRHRSGVRKGLWLVPSIAEPTLTASLRFAESQQGSADVEATLRNLCLSAALLALREHGSNPVTGSSTSAGRSEGITTHYDASSRPRRWTGASARRR